MQQAELFRRQRQVGIVNVVLWFIVWGLSAIICGICERYWGSRVLSTKEETQETVAARMQQTVTVSHFVASQATTKI